MRDPGSIKDMFFFSSQNPRADYFQPDNPNIVNVEVNVEIIEIM